MHIKPLYMSKLRFIALSIFLFTNTYSSFADTIDVWTIKLNGKVIVRSNVVEIIYAKRPMHVNIGSYSEFDSIQICYWTDGGLEHSKWFYIFKDSANNLIKKFENPVDSSLLRYGYRKNYISFTVGSLKRMLKSKNIDKVFIALFHDNTQWNKEYINKTVCLISSDP